MKELVKNVKHLMEYRKQIPEKGFIELIQKIFADFGEVSWELGPSLEDSKKDQLSISVDRDSKYYHQLVKTFEEPVSGPDWMICFGLPPKQWELFFEITHEGKLYEIEASDWFWKANVQENKVNLYIYFPVTYSKYPEELFDYLPKIALVGEIGEINFHEYVRIISRSIIKNERNNVEIFPMEEFKHYFVKKVPECKFSKILSR